MTGGPMHPSQIMHAIHQNAGLRNRIEAIVRSKRWNDPSADPRASVPVTDIAWAVATNTTIHTFVTERIVEGNIGGAVDQIVEGDLEYTTITALARLEAISSTPTDPSDPPPE